MEEFISYKEKIFSVSPENFPELALSLFKIQARDNFIYRLYLDKIGCFPDKVDKIEEIPFLPISLFRNTKVKTGSWKEDIIFRSSGTTSVIRSNHFIRDLDFYQLTCLTGFRLFYNDPADYILLALMPSYNQNIHSSLLQMINCFVDKSGFPESGFYLDNIDSMIGIVNRTLVGRKSKLMIWGLTYALLDFAEKHTMDLKECIIMETGGMKGRREEMIRKEVHEILKTRLNVDSIHSEYGMTELHSQAYSAADGLFQTPPWMKILIRDINDPFEINNNLKYGAVNIIDLANFQTCAFIATEDIGKIGPDGRFEVIGRIDNSELRGCNLLLN